MRADAFVLFPDPEWLENSRKAARDNRRRSLARLHRYLPPPREKHCPPRPSDGLCECCGGPTKKFYLDHCHETGEFREWVCRACNTGVGMVDEIEHLEKRIAFLKAHEKKVERIALIKAVREEQKAKM